ncbi:helix-turn-helix domain-containing protein, partial [Rhodococcus sp. O3]
MARTRTYDLDGLLDAAERIAAESGAAAVTLRALTDATGMSNGAIYHAFGSRLGVVGQA